MDSIVYQTDLKVGHLLSVPQDPTAHKQQWQDIRQSRLCFLKTPTDTSCLQHVRPEILESWIRSYAYGVDANKTCMSVPIAETLYQQVYQSHENLIVIASSLMQMINELNLSSEYLFELMSVDGLSLFQLGNMKLHQHVATQSVFNETTMGTNAHSLCMLHRSPCLVIGPEHYCLALHNLTACAVPIFDETGKVKASLLFTRCNPETPWTKDYLKLLSHTVILIVSIATAIENKLLFEHCLRHLNEMEAEVDFLRKRSRTPLPVSTAEVEIVSSPSKKSHSVRTNTAVPGEKASITFKDILGKSSSLAHAITLAKRFSHTSENILITGESGTGKEYFAQAIHNYSCKNGPFMSINCAAIPHRLIESELFGYESGSFTGADRGGKPGKIELADGGTLFLDEIGDMPLELQATLLRVLENKRVIRIGGKSYKQVKFRVIAATNRNLQELISEGRFRQDLFYRLSVLSVELPPLRNRLDDLELYIEHYLQAAMQKNSDEKRIFSSEALQLIREYEWPGNVRQLKNAIISSYYSAQTEIIDRNDLPRFLTETQQQDQVLEEDHETGESLASPAEEAENSHNDEHCIITLSEMETKAIKAALQITGYKVSQAAELLGISKATLYRKIKENNLSDTLSQK